MGVNRMLSKCYKFLEHLKGGNVDSKGAYGQIEVPRSSRASTQTEKN